MSNKTLTKRNKKIFAAIAIAIIAVLVGVFLIIYNIQKPSKNNDSSSSSSSSSSLSSSSSQSVSSQSSSSSLQSSSSSSDLSDKIINPESVTPPVNETPGA